MYDDSPVSNTGAYEESRPRLHWAQAQYVEDLDWWFYLQGPDKETDLQLRPVAIIRHPEFGNLNGYVSVARSSSLFGRAYENIDVDVHGGLTYSGESMHPPLHHPGQNEALLQWESFMYIARPTLAEAYLGIDPFWWLGFDTAHHMDIMPAIAPLGIIPGSEYRTLGYLEEQIWHLVQQITLIESCEKQLTIGNINDDLSAVDPRLFADELPPRDFDL